ncbi:hypothetical protein KKC94_05240 [Patescibacteria group bacterium]|nr:hypothetical protein [Patescibacteria group bacterium]
METNTIHRQFVEYGRTAREWMRKCEVLLPLVEQYEIWKEKGFSSIYEYAAKLAGMSRSKVEDCLRIYKKIEDKPALREVAERKGINAVRPVITLATTETEVFWAEKAKEMSVGTLKAYAKEFRELSNHEQVGFRDVPESVTLSPELAKKLKQFLKRENAEELLEAFLEEQEKPEVAETVNIPARMRQFVIERTGGHCAYPSCNKPYVELHHTGRQAIELKHNPDHIHALCKFHHELAHNGLIGNEEGPPHTWYILQKPDPSNHKYFIDQQVQLIRHNAVL